MILFRYKALPDCTRGMLFVGDDYCHTLEPPWKDNQRNVSCIPQGEYDYYYMERSGSGKYRGCYHITNVPGRSEILIHSGNTPDHTLGCILVGKKSGYLAGMPAVLSSRIALRELNQDAEERGKIKVISWIGS